MCVIASDNIDTNNARAETRAVAPTRLRFVAVLPSLVRCFGTWKVLLTWPSLQSLQAATARMSNYLTTLEEKIDLMEKKKR